MHRHSCLILHEGFFSPSVAAGQGVQRLPGAGSAADGRAEAYSGEAARGASGEGDGDLRHEVDHL